MSLSRWIMRPHPEFGGRTPREETIAHGSQSVIKVARNTDRGRMVRALGPP